MKKIILALFLISFLTLPVVGLATVPPTPCPARTADGDVVCLTPPFPPGYICRWVAGACVAEAAPEIPLLVGLERIINVLFGVLIVVAVIYVIIGAWSLMTAAGDATKIEAGRTKILYALIAVVVALLARGLIEFIRRVIAP